MGYTYPDLDGDGFYETGTPCCDICGRAEGDSPNVLRDDQPADWNPETGNHLTCEPLAQTLIVDI